MYAFGKKRQKQKNKYGVERLTAHGLRGGLAGRTLGAAYPGCTGPHQGGARGGAGLVTRTGHQHRTLLRSPQKMGSGLDTRSKGRGNRVKRSENQQPGEGGFSAEQTSIQVPAGYAVLGPYRPRPACQAHMGSSSGGGQWGGGGVEVGQIMCCC